VGRPEAPVPEGAPAKELAEYLRDLRRKAGNPSYRVLGELVFIRHNALSQSVDGRYVGWARVQRYVDALRAYRRARDQPDVVHDVDVAELRRLHERAAAEVRARSQPARRTSRLVRLWAEQEDLAAARSLRTPPEPPPPPAAPVAGDADRRRLEAATTVADLLGCLNDLVLSAKIDLEELRRGPDGSAPASWFDPGGSDEWLMLTGRRVPDLNLMLALVRRCGGTEADCLAWRAAWHEIAEPAGWHALAGAVPARTAAAAGAVSARPDGADGSGTWYDAAPAAGVEPVEVWPTGAGPTRTYPRLPDAAVGDGPPVDIPRPRGRFAAALRRLAAGHSR
jgi:hypothetical protein